MPNFTGQLNANEIFAAIFNMIISQHVFADNIDGVYGDLSDECRVDGSLYGDTKLYYSSDALRSFPWLGDEESENLLQIHRPKAPKCQAITINVFRQVPLTVDSYLSRRAWSTEAAFSSFNSIMLGWIRDTKRIYDATTINAYYGTSVSAVEGSRQNLTVNLPTSEDPEAQNRLRAQTIATYLADLIVDLKDVSRDFNDYGHIRSYNPEKLRVVWNSAFKNKITYMDLPTIFHEKGLMDVDSKFKQTVLPARYFGTVNAEGGTAPTPNNTIRSLIETDYNTGGDEDVHLFPGDLIPAGSVYLANETYTVDPTIVCKITHTKSLPFMSGFETGTSFFNSKSLTENHYLTWAHNSLEYLKNYPWITIKANEAAAAAAEEPTG